MWREVLRFADGHQSEDGNSKWHIFAYSPIYLIVAAQAQTSEMEAGEHLILGTSPGVRGLDSSGSVDLVWIAPFGLRQGNTALGKQGFWGCDTAVSWLEDCFLPHLLKGQTREQPAPSLLDRLLRRSPASIRVPKVADFFYASKAIDWASMSAISSNCFLSLVTALQRHFSFRSESTYPGAYIQFVDRALMIVLQSATDPELNYLRAKGEFDSAESKSDMLRSLEKRLRNRDSTVTGGQLEYRLRAVGSVVRNPGKLDMSSAEFQNVANILRPLAEAAYSYNRLLAHRAKPSTTFPV